MGKGDTMPKNPAYFIVLRNKSFICKKADHDGPFVLPLAGIPDLPNVPFYHHLYSDQFKEYVRLFREFRRDRLLNHGFLPGIRKPHACIALPDDALEVDYRMVKEFLLAVGGVHTVTIAAECALLAPPAGTYLALARTARMFVLTQMTDGNIVRQKYLEKKEYSPAELKDIVRTFTSYGDRSQTPVYLTGEDVAPYSALGTVVAAESILDHYIELMLSAPNKIVAH
jgi:hypothetical protein